MPNPPIPQAARPIVERVNRRYRVACKRGERSAIDDPRNVPLTALERCHLAACGYYPIPIAVIRLGMTPAEYHRQQVLDTVDRRLAEQLPDAVAAVLETLEV